ncbi:MAG: SOS response-associated peptidase [Clostridiaceae bacterium]|nr:SOS response-associated peptidase [Clostridiaceae bacterium]
MCGRYQLDYEFEQLMFRFNTQNRYIGYGTKHEIFPTDMVAVVIREWNQNYLDSAKWGFDNPYDKRPLINARAETIDEKKTFKNLFTSSRCIVPATAFYEWKKNSDNSKTKMLISVEEIPVFSMAGLYKVETDTSGNTIKRYTIITTSAGRQMSEIHDRMPVILPKDSEDIWLDNSMNNIQILKELLKPYRGNLLFKSV